MNFTETLAEADQQLAQLTNSEKIAWLDEKITHCSDYEIIGILLQDWRDCLIFMSDSEFDQAEKDKRWPWARAWTGEGLPPHLLRGVLNV